MNLRSPTWSVIKFPDENLVCAVPTSWLLSNITECYWPLYPQILVRMAIEKNKMPDSTTWKLFSYNGFRNNIYGMKQTFLQVKKSVLAMKCSDLDSHSDMERVAVSSCKRKIFKKMYSFSSVKESEGKEAHHVLPLLPMPPTFKPQYFIKYIQKTNNDDLCASSSQYNGIEDDGASLSGTPSRKEKLQKLSLTGGNDLYDFIFRTTQKLITNSFSSQFSWLGRKGKRVFKNLTLSQLVIKAAMKTKKLYYIQEAKVSIQKWLKRCKERAKNEKF
ncbi:hypothetical protein RN001_005401 [Aquatica leii]|uniref:DUF4806 domain-containing protein n=1 Tax=Aquatica leii TaxID=1421715 RepID=A0AAN7Q1A5_9COLE|nr:hypothetical protein RN001_005401 [Aquatica leii]